MTETPTSTKKEKTKKQKNQEKRLITAAILIIAGWVTVYANSIYKFEIMTDNWTFLQTTAALNTIIGFVIIIVVFLWERFYTTDEYKSIDIDLLAIILIGISYINYCVTIKANLNYNITSILSGVSWIMYAIAALSLLYTEIAPIFKHQSRM